MRDMPRKLSLKVLASIAALSLFGAFGAWGTFFQGKTASLDLTWTVGG